MNVKIYHKEFDEEVYNKALWLLRRTYGSSEWSKSTKKQFMFNACLMIEG